jgi:hypothetical protein
VENHGSKLRRELREARREAAYWKARARWLEQSRNYWRKAAKAWQWSALH